MARLRIGELLVSAKVISEAQLEAALAAPRDGGKRLGDVLVQLGFVNETQLTQALSQQLSVPWVSLYHTDFSRQLLDLVPREMAERYCLVPIFVRRAKKRGDTLYVAMDDPTNEAAIEQVSQFAGLPTRPMIASKSDIRNAIRVYYAGGSAEPVEAHEAGVESAPPPPAPPPPPEPPLRPQAAAAPAPPPPPAPTSSPALDDADEPPDSIQPGTPDKIADLTPPPAPKRGRARPMVALTLLDGTTIQLPSRKRNADAPHGPSDGLTARDLISALRAVSHGADATEILGEDAKWQAMFAALLSLLLRKGLIADWEFVEEYRKI